MVEITLKNTENTGHQFPVAGLMQKPIILMN